MITDYENRQIRVRRPWPGGPARGAIINPPKGRLQALLRLRLVEIVEPEKPRPRRRKQVESDGVLD